MTEALGGGLIGFDGKGEGDAVAACLLASIEGAVGGGDKVVWGRLERSEAAGFGSYPQDAGGRYSERGDQIAGEAGCVAGTEACELIAVEAHEAVIRADPDVIHRGFA